MERRSITLKGISKNAVLYKLTFQYFTGISITLKSESD